LAFISDEQPQNLTKKHYVLLFAIIAVPISDRALHNLAYDIHQDRRQMLAALAANYKIHRHTIHTYLRRLDFGNYIALRKPYLSPIYRAIRLAFACKYRHWTEQDWYNII